MSAHAHLKKATQGAHERVDDAFGRYDLADASDYGRFLQRHAAAFLPAEQALTAAGAGSLIEGWEDQLRAPALRLDLVALGLDLPQPLAAPDYADESAILGGVYVLEGSRLGGTILREKVAPEFPRAFLDSVHPKGRWRALIAQLNRRLCDPRRLEIATKSALETFSMFESAGAGRTE